MADETVRALTVQIVSAHIGNNTVSPTDLPRLINDVHQALVKAGQPAPPQRGEPAVAVRQSVKADHLVCLECEVVSPRGPGLRQGALRIGKKYRPRAAPGQHRPDGNSAPGSLTLARRPRFPLE